MVINYRGGDEEQLSEVLMNKYFGGGSIQFFLLFSENFHYGTHCFEFELVRNLFTTNYLVGNFYANKKNYSVSQIL